MTALIITDIKCSKWDIGQDIITAVIVNAECEDFSRLLIQAKEICQSQMILESATALEDLPEIDVKKGDLFIRMQASFGHDLKVGDELVLDMQG
jgi:Ni,Fe-hydrogenase III large subunit